MKNNFKNLMLQILGLSKIYYLIRKKLLFIANFYRKALLICGVEVGKLEFLAKSSFKVSKTETI